MACAAHIVGKTLQTSYLMAESVSRCCQLLISACAFKEKLSGGGGCASAGGKAGISCWVRMGAAVEAGHLGAQAAHSSGSSSITGQTRGLTLGIFIGKSFSVTKFGGVVARSGAAAGGFLCIPNLLHTRCALRVALGYQVRVVRAHAEGRGKGQRQGAH
jgi:hypothetical protein